MKFKLNRDKVELKMAENCFTTSDLAEAYGVSKARIAVILNSQRLTPACVGRLAKALHCDVTEIIED